MPFIGIISIPRNEYIYKTSSLRNISLPTILFAIITVIILYRFSL